MYGIYDATATLAALNRRLKGAQQRHPDVFPASLPPLEALTDLAHLPVLGKEHCVPERVAFDNARGHELILASGGSSGRPAVTLQSRDEFLTEGRIFANALQGFLPTGRRQWLFVNATHTFGLWGGGYLCFVTSMSHRRFIGANVGGYGSDGLVAVLRQILTRGASSHLEGLLIVGLPDRFPEIASDIHALTTELGLQTRFVFIGDALGRSQAATIKARCPACEILSYYGTSEANGVGIGAMPFLDGEPRPIPFRALPESSIAWIRDEESGEPILDPGRPGRLVVTNLYCEEKPFNFAGTFDLVAWDKPGETFTLRGRAQDHLIVLGLMKFDVTNLIDRVLEASGGVAGQVVVTGASHLQLRIDQPARILTSEELYRCAIQAIPFHQSQIRGLLTLEMVEGTIKTAVGKLSRLIDERPRDGVR